jgi:dTDP-4-amino-4,6-dideoxygalactose transaminase
MINVFGSNVGQEEIDELSGSVRTGWMGMGNKVRQFEREFGERIGSPFVMVDSGSNALYLAVKLLDLPTGSEIIVPSLTWVACAHAVILAGHRIRFCDVDQETQNLTVREIEKCITADTKAIMVVHYAGKPVRLDEIASFGLPIIEDAAHAVDSKLGEKYCGTIGRVGIYSFDSVKNLATPEGGGIATNDPELVQRATYLRYCGIGKSGFDSFAAKSRWWEYDIREVFPKFLPNDVSASIGLAQLRKLDANQRRRREIWDVYQSELQGVDWLRGPVGPAPDERHSYFTYFCRAPSGRRDALAHALLDQGVYTTFRYHPLHLNPIYGSEQALPNCELLNEQGINLPLHPALMDDDVSAVVRAVKAFRC